MEDARARAAFAWRVASKFHPRWPSIMAFNWISNNIDLLFAVVIRHYYLCRCTHRPAPADAVAKRRPMMRACNCYYKMEFMHGHTVWQAPVHFAMIYFSCGKFTGFRFGDCCRSGILHSAFFAIRLARRIHVSRNFAALVCTQTTRRADATIHILWSLLIFMNAFSVFDVSPRWYSRCVCVCVCASI